MHENREIIEVLKENVYTERYKENETGVVTDILSFFSKEKLEKFQRSLSKATGLAFVTVDFRGEPITEATFFSDFCIEVRKSKVAKSRCKSSDAFGAIQAAVSHETSIYICPCGLLEVAIPIVINGQYLGGFIGGQIRCNDAPENVSRLSNIMKNKEADSISKACSCLLDSIPIYSYEKFKDIASLVTIVVNEICDNAINLYKHEEILRDEIKKLQKLNLENMEHRKTKDNLIDELIISSNPYEVIDMLSSVLNLTIIENADKSSDLLELYLEYYKYTNSKNETFAYLSEELEHIENYLLLNQKKYGKRIDFSIQVPKSIHTLKIPSKILLPFVKNSVHNSILLKEEGGKVSINARFDENKDLIFEIFDNGRGVSKRKVDIKSENYIEKNEVYYIDLAMQFAKEKLTELFEENYNIEIDYLKNNWQRCTITLPEFYEERA